MNWIRNTGQVRKVAVFFVLLVVAGLLLIAFVATISDTADPNPWLAAGFVSLGIAAAGWLFVSVQCPSCGVHVAWWLATHAQAGAWLSEMLSLRVCPNCGSPPARQSKRGDDT